MELRQLAYLDAVARYGGFTKAAQALHVAQSAVSAQVRALESELGTPLFARTTRSVALTQAGELFLARARRALAELDAGRTELTDLAGVLRGRLTIGATSITGSFDLPATLATFHRAYPGVALRLRSGLIAALLRLLDEGEADLVLGPRHDDLPGRYVARTVAAEQLVLIVPPGHRLARVSVVAFADLRDEPFVCLSGHSGLRAILDAAAAAAGFTAQVPFETHSPAGIRDLVSAGLGVALVARSAVERPGAAVSVRPVEPAPAHPPIALMHLRERPLATAARAFRRSVTSR